VQQSAQHQPARSSGPLDADALAAESKMQ